MWTTHQWLDKSGIDCVYKQWRANQTKNIFIKCWQLIIVYNPIQHHWMDVCTSLSLVPLDARAVWDVWTIFVLQQFVVHRHVDVRRKRRPKESQCRSFFYYEHLVTIVSIEKNDAEQSSSVDWIERNLCGFEVTEVRQLNSADGVFTIRFGQMS